MIWKILIGAVVLIAVFEAVVAARRRKRAAQGQSSNVYPLF